MRMYKNKILFCHIPKTAGTTFKSFLYQIFPESKVCPIWDESILLNNFKRNIKKYDLFHGHFDFSLLEKFPKRPFVITFLRDPVSRIVSYYYYMRSLSEDVVKHSTEEAASVILDAKNNNHYDFFSKLSGVKDRYFYNMQVRQLGAGVKHEINYDNFDYQLLLAKQNLTNIDFVGDVESFDESLERLEDKIGIEFYNKSNVLNKTSNKNDSLVFDNDFLKLVDRYIKYDKCLYDFYINKIKSQRELFA